MPFFLTLLADAERMAKEWNEGLSHLAEAEWLMAETEEWWGEAELRRVRGELLRIGQNPAAAERSSSGAVPVETRGSPLGLDLGGASLSVALLSKPASPGEPEPEVATDALALAAGGVADRELIAALGIEAQKGIDPRRYAAGEFQPCRLLQQRHPNGRSGKVVDASPPQSRQILART